MARQRRLLRATQAHLLFNVANTATNNLSFGCIQILIGLVCPPKDGLLVAVQWHLVNFETGRARCPSLGLTLACSCGLTEGTR